MSAARLAGGRRRRIALTCLVGVAFATAPAWGKEPEPGPSAVERCVTSVLTEAGLLPFSFDPTLLHADDARFSGKEAGGCAERTSADVLTGSAAAKDAGTAPAREGDDDPAGESEAPGGGAAAEHAAGRDDETNRESRPARLAPAGDGETSRESRPVSAPQGLQDDGRRRRPATAAQADGDDETSRESRPATFAADSNVVDGEAQRGADGTSSASDGEDARTGSTVIGQSQAPAPAPAQPAAPPAVAPAPAPSQGQAGRAGSDRRATTRRRRAAGDRPRSAPSSAGGRTDTGSPAPAPAAGPEPTPAASAGPGEAGASTADGPARSVRKQGDGTTVDLGRRTNDDVPMLAEPDDDSVFPRVVRDVVEVVPTAVRVAIAGLVLLVLGLGAYLLATAARARRLERHRAELLEDIGLLQAALLPDVPARLGALATTVAYRPADGPAAGGDFYDAFALSDGRVGLLLGDVSGHGRQALAKTTLVRFTVRAHLETGMSPREALAIAGRSLDDRLSDDFATVVAAIHDPSAGTLTYASAGHPPPLVVGPPAHQPVTASSAPPIGAGFPTGQRQTVLPMPEGTSICLYSDGLLEARIDEELLGRERLAEWLAELGPDATAEQMLDLVVARADRLHDDLAACVLHAAAGADAPATRVEQLKLDVLDIDGPGLEGFLMACGVAEGERRSVGRRVSEQLAVSGGVVVEVRAGEHPSVSVAPIGDDAASVAARPAPAR